MDKVAWDGLAWMALNVLRVVWSRFAARYRPERHYMRGPGPKTLDRLGRELRARSDTVTSEPLPRRWVELMATLEKRSPRGDGDEKS